MKGFLGKMLERTKKAGGNSLFVPNPYDPINDEAIEKVYDDIKNVIKSPENNSKIEKNMPFNVQKILQMQESVLNNNGLMESKTESMYKHLANKSKKKEDELLIRKMDHLRIKKELDEITINKNKSPGNYPHGGTWIMNLRGEKNSQFPATSYLNYGENGGNPYYVPIRERRNKSIDIIRDPKSHSKIHSKLIIGNKDILQDKSNFNDKSSLNSSTMNFVQTLNVNLHNNSSYQLDDITSVQSSFTTKNQKKSWKDMVVKFIIFCLFFFILLRFQEKIY
jgi:hypothetical protein